MDFEDNSPRSELVDRLLSEPNSMSLGVKFTVNAREVKAFEIVIVPPEGGSPEQAVTVVRQAFEAAVLDICRSGIGGDVAEELQKVVLAVFGNVS